jgi:hypothetical protein
MIATLAWVGGVMYLANLAHSILRSQKESHSMGSPMMGMSRVNGGSSSGRDQVNVRFGMEDYANTDVDYKEWLESDEAKEWMESERAKYGSGLESAAYKSSQKSGNNVGTNVNVRFGKEQDAKFEEWLQYQKHNAVKYDANGKYGKSQSTAAMLQADASATQEVSAPEALLSDSSVSTIDWPMKMGLSSPSCTILNGCAPSNNVTVLIVYGPEYHSHISEMAWNVALGVVSNNCVLDIELFVK